MAFNGTEGGFIEIEDAQAMTKRYRDQAGSSPVRSVFFGKEKLNELLSQGSGAAAAMGIRFYFAHNAKGEIGLVAVGANAEQNDQIGGTYKILDLATPCPGEGCPPTLSPLES